MWNQNQTQNIKNKIKMVIVTIYYVVLWFSAYQILICFGRNETQM